MEEEGGGKKSIEFVPLILWDDDGVENFYNGMLVG